MQGARRFRVLFSDKSDVSKVIDAIKAHCHCSDMNDAARAKTQKKTQRQPTLAVNASQISSSQLPTSFQYSQSIEPFCNAAPVVSSMNFGAPSSAIAYQQSARAFPHNLSPPPQVLADISSRPRSAMDPPRTSSIRPDSSYPPRPISDETSVQRATSSISWQPHFYGQDQRDGQNPLPRPSAATIHRATMEIRNGSGSSGSLSQNQPPSSLDRLAPNPEEDISRIQPPVDVSSNSSAVEVLIASLHTDAKEGCVESMLSLTQSDLQGVVLELLSEPGFSDLVSVCRTVGTSLTRFDFIVSAGG